MSLVDDLKALGVAPGDGLFVHCSLKAVGTSPDGLIQGLLDVVGPEGLIGMPGFSTDAYFPADLDRAQMTAAEITAAEASVPGFDIEESPVAGIGVVPEVFRQWSGTLRSDHPAVAICLNGRDAERYIAPHQRAWATGPGTPLGHLMDRPGMKILLLGVGWNRCTPLHTAETYSEVRRTKVRRWKEKSGEWLEAPDVADDLGRLFPAVGDAFEATGQVTTGKVGKSEARLCDYPALVNFSADWISDANRRSGDRH